MDGADALREPPAQYLDMIRQQRQPPLRQINGEEEAPTRNEVAAVRGHDAVIKCDGFRKGSTHPTG